MRTLVCTILFACVGGCLLIGSTCLADTFDAPTAVIARGDGSFQYTCIFRKGPGTAYCSAYGWGGRYNVTGGYHVDCFCQGAINEGDSILIGVAGQLIDLKQPGVADEGIGFCDGYPGQDASTQILPYQVQVHLDSPNGGEQLIVGQSTQISWTAIGSEGAIAVDLYV